MLEPVPESLLEPVGASEQVLLPVPVPEPLLGQVLLPVPKPRVGPLSVSACLREQ